ncbi:hypothetical protein LOZ65_000055 [Ophidiomyces ophidiicola]|nr:hypothetical protein LOZ65_000055 [Ophidiomyces ophidiicola]
MAVADGMGIMQGSSGNSVTSTPPWSDLLHFDNVDGLGSGIVSSLDVPTSDISVMGANQGQTDVLGIAELMDAGGCAYQFDPKFAMDFENDFLHLSTTTQAAMPAVSSHTYSPSSLSLPRHLQEVGSQYISPPQLAVQPVTSHPALDTNTLHSVSSSSSSSSVTQSPPGSSARSVAPRRKKEQTTSSDPSDAAAEKRRRNTLAARRFRQRQQDRIAQLERALEQVAQERDELKMQVAKWEGEATALRGILGKRSSRE